MTTTRLSPLHDLLAGLQVEWRDNDDATWAWRFPDRGLEAEAARRLGICDLSPLRKLGCRGPGAKTWLEQQQISVPTAVGKTARLVGGGWIACTGTHDYFLESGLDGQPVSALDTALDTTLRQGGSEVVRVEQQQATFLLQGTRALELLAQTCSLDLRSTPPGQLLMTRVAATNCFVLPESSPGTPRFRLWLDPTFAVYLWEVLTAICEELGGGPFGVAMAAGEQVVTSRGEML